MRFDPRAPSWLECWLGPLEARVMEEVWTSRGPAPPTIARIVRAVLRTSKTARRYTTVSTTVYRLIEKGVLSRTTPERHYHVKVFPLLSRDEFNRSHIEPVLRRLYREVPDMVIEIVLELVKERK